MELVTAEKLIATRHQGVLVTLRRSGRPQMSNIVYSYEGGVARISVTATRAKTANLRRNPMGTLYVASDSFWEFVVADGEAAVSAVTEVPGDAVGQELLEVYEKITEAKHSDPAEYFDAMVTDQRCIVRLTIDHVYGQLG